MVAPSLLPISRSFALEDNIKHLGNYSNKGHNQFSREQSDPEGVGAEAGEGKH